MSDTMCKERVWSSWHQYQCERKATRDGYCWQHHPDAKAERERKTHEAYEQKERQSDWFQLKEARARIAEAETERDALRDKLHAEVERIAKETEANSSLSWDDMMNAAIDEGVKK